MSPFLDTVKTFPGTGNVTQLRTFPGTGNVT